HFTSVVCWLYKCSVQKLVVVISNIESDEVLERWQFDIECDKTAKDDSTRREKSQKAIQDEIRQITATVTFLPLLKVSCSCRCCDTEEDAQVANQWLVSLTIREMQVKSTVRYHTTQLPE
uniref:HORMA domain-containing protein n=1 Tax=Canis lupus familiaris TaxID=9615 RepID=A0A8P0PIV4_CANLF